MASPTTHDATRVSARPDGPPSGRVLVVGGYGAVGMAVCHALRRHSGLRLVIAGRRLEAAQAAASELGAEALRLDVDDRSTWAAALNADLVVMCIDQTDTALARILLSAGVGYLDLTAGDGFFQALEATPPSRGLAVLSVGLAPGLTNMMVASAASRFDQADHAEIGLLFGLGDRHGEAGLNWTLDQVLGAPAERSRADFGRPWGERHVHRVAFADQYALSRTGTVRSARTGLCFDSALATGLAFRFAPRLPRGGLAQGLMRRAFAVGTIGSRACSIAVRVEGRRADGPGALTLRFHAEGESATTGALAALAVERCLASPPPPGVWHSHQVISPDAFILAAARAGVGRFELPDRYFRNPPASADQPTESAPCLA